jgi:uncharacterized protein YndB with AHSA1/START domain
MTTTAERTITVTRTVRAPRALVFRAWTDPDHLDWFFNDTVDRREPIELDLRVGGFWRQKMIQDERTEYWTGGLYREIVPDRRLVFVFGAVDGWPALDPAHPEASPLVTVDLTERDGVTDLVLTMELPPGFAEGEAGRRLVLDMTAGWGITLDRLVAAFASRPRFGVPTGDDDAPPEPTEAPRRA